MARRFLKVPDDVGVEELTGPEVVAVLEPVVEESKWDSPPVDAVPEVPVSESARPAEVRDAAVHKGGCGHIAILRPDVALALARTPGIVSHVRCPHCLMRAPLAEYTWHGTTDPLG